MSLVQRALWHIECQAPERVTLTSIARLCGVSTHHLSRAFGEVVGMSFMAFAKARRLSKAARQLHGQQCEILPVALEAGYSSHEAFSRAFREHFQMTPTAVRSLPQLNHLKLQEPLFMTELEKMAIPTFRIETAPAMRLTGLWGTYDSQTRVNIPMQWQAFAPHLGQIPGQTSPVSYGVCRATGEGEHCIDYMCAVEINPTAAIQSGLSELSLPEQSYAVFTHDAHVSMLHQSYAAIFGAWQPPEGHQIARAPDFERYGSGFNPITGFGDMEIWIPLEPTQA